jgi:hypothetical protein
VVHRPIRRQHIDVIRNLFAVDNLPLLCLDVAVDLYDTSICIFECVVTFGYFKVFSLSGLYWIHLFARFSTVLDWIHLGFFQVFNRFARHAHVCCIS